MNLKERLSEEILEGIPDDGLLKQHRLHFWRAGQVILTEVFDTEMMLATLMVDEAVRRLGAGNLLPDWATEETRNNRRKVIKRINKKYEQR